MAETNSNTNHEQSQPKKKYAFNDEYPMAVILIPMFSEKLRPLAKALARTVYSNTVIDSFLDRKSRVRMIDYLLGLGYIEFKRPESIILKRPDVTDEALVSRMPVANQEDVKGLLTAWNDDSWGDDD